MRTLYRLADRGILKKEGHLPWKGKRKPNGHSEKRGKQAFRRDLRERADSYPDFKPEFGHLEGDTIVGKNFLIGNLFPMHMTLIFSLRIQDVLVNEVSMNILMAY